MGRREIVHWLHGKGGHDRLIGCRGGSDMLNGFRYEGNGVMKRGKVRLV